MPLPTLTLLALMLIPAQGGKLEVTNIRATHGVFGPTRPEFKILPGDILHVQFDINDLTPDADGRLHFRTQMTVLQLLANGKEETVYEEKPSDLPPVPVVNVLGGTKVPHSVAVTTGIKQTPGAYRLKVTVHDLQGKREGFFARDFSVEKPDFGLVRLQVTYDRLGQLPAPAVGAVGQTLYLNAVAVGYKSDPKDQQASLLFELTALDEADKPVGKPLTGEVKGMAVDSHVPFRFELPLHRAGRFKVVVKATDQVAKKTVSMIVPLQSIN
jgi:hypothetical protein